ncbi:MAG: hypothetical protein M1837_003212 [Sclerophora amabilis]|nr:MAG: hypothetical protein M1837_003212 [Sclerophora amabilis]
MKKRLKEAHGAKIKLRDKKMAWATQEKKTWDAMDPEERETEKAKRKAPIDMFAPGLGAPIWAEMPESMAHPRRLANTSHSSGRTKVLAFGPLSNQPTNSSLSTSRTNVTIAATPEAGVARFSKERSVSTQTRPGFKSLASVQSDKTPLIFERGLEPKPVEDILYKHGRVFFNTLAQYIIEYYSAAIQERCENQAKRNSQIPVLLRQISEQQLKIVELENSLEDREERLAILDSPFWTRYSGIAPGLRRVSGDSKQISTEFHGQIFKSANTKEEIGEQTPQVRSAMRVAAQQRSTV